MIWFFGVYMLFGLFIAIAYCVYMEEATRKLPWYFDVLTLLLMLMTYDYIWMAACSNRFWCNRCA